MRKILIGSITVMLGVSTAVASGAFAGGNGAQHSGLSVQEGSSNGTDECMEGSGAATNGFVMLNAPGKPGNANKLIGEVALKNAVPGTYDVYVALADGNDVCMPETTLTTNARGNGNAHIADPTLGNGTFYVVLKSGMDEKYASGELTVN